MLKKCYDSFSFCDNFDNNVNFDCYKSHLKYKKEVVFCPNGRKKFIYLREVFIFLFKLFYL